MSIWRKPNNYEFSIQRSHQIAQPVPFLAGIWTAFLLHLMSLAGIEFQSTHTAFHWQMMKNNDQITLLRLYSRERFPPCFNLNNVSEADTTRQEESKYLTNQHQISVYFKLQEFWHILHFHVCNATLSKSGCLCLSDVYTQKQDFTWGGGCLFSNRC